MTGTNQSIYVEPPGALFVINVARLNACIGASELLPEFRSIQALHDRPDLIGCIKARER